MRETPRHCAGPAGTNATQCNADSAGGVGRFLPDFLSHALLILSKLDGLESLPRFPVHFHVAQEILDPLCQFLNIIFPFFMNHINYLHRAWEAGLGTHRVYPSNLGEAMGCQGQAGRLNGRGGAMDTPVK